MRHHCPRHGTSHRHVQPGKAFALMLHSEACHSALECHFARILAGCSSMIERCRTSRWKLASRTIPIHPMYRLQCCSRRQTALASLPLHLGTRQTCTEIQATRPQTQTARPVTHLIRRKTPCSLWMGSSSKAWSNRCSSARQVTMAGSNADRLGCCA